MKMIMSYLKDKIVTKEKKKVTLRNKYIIK